MQGPDSQATRTSNLWTGGHKPLLGCLVVLVCRPVAPNLYSAVPCRAVSTLGNLEGLAGDSNNAVPCRAVYSYDSRLFTSVSFAARRKICQAERSRGYARHKNSKAQSRRNNATCQHCHRACMLTRKNPEKDMYYIYSCVL